VLIWEKLKSEYGVQIPIHDVLDLLIVDGHYDNFDQITQETLNAKQFFIAELLEPKWSKRRHWKWREPPLLVNSEGAQWTYQADPTLSRTLLSELESHYKYWKQGSRDEEKHPLFMCFGGAGTGKSRLLSEFPRLIKESVEGVDGLEQIVKNLYCFNVVIGSEYRQKKLNIGTRMMDQLRGSSKYDMLTEPFSIQEVAKFLAGLTRQHVSEISVVLCIDGIHDLKSWSDTETSELIEVMDAVCRAINTSDVFIIAICSSLYHDTFSNGLNGSKQRIIELAPASIKPELIFEEKDELSLLLASDLGGHGRALEQLFILLKEQSVEEVGLNEMTLRLISRIRKAYPRYFMFFPVKLLWHIVSGKKANLLKTSDLKLAMENGMFRLTTDGFLEYPYILWPILLTFQEYWDGFNSWTTEERLEVQILETWAEHIHRDYRIIKSQSFGHKIVSWKEIHSGAKFSEDCDDFVHERVLRFDELHLHWNSVARPVPNWNGNRVACGHLKDALSFCTNVGLGDLYLCFYSEKKQ
jgi:hypothetical protein